jgi:putative FmdB family regulatory protein
LPIYKYECPKCGSIEEKFRYSKERDDAVICPECKTDMKRTYGLSTIEFRDHTTGWAKRNYKEGTKDYVKFTKDTNYEKIYNNKKVFNKLPRQTQIQYEREIRQQRTGIEY